jgi:hypothetical protein
MRHLIVLRRAPDAASHMLRRSGYCRDGGMPAGGQGAARAMQPLRAAKACAVRV